MKTYLDLNMFNFVTKLSENESTNRKITKTHRAATSTNYSP